MLLHLTCLVMMEILIRFTTRAQKTAVKTELAAGTSATWNVTKEDATSKIRTPFVVTEVSAIKTIPTSVFATAGIALSKIATPASAASARMAVRVTMKRTGTITTRPRRSQLT